jgi:hypothetical protein
MPQSRPCQTAAWMLAFASLVVAAQASAQVYKCKRGAVIAYQDKPCPKGTELGRITLDAPPPPGKTPSSSAGPPKPAPERGPPAPLAPALLPAAANYKCTGFDGKSYFSASNMPRRQQVPVYALPTPPPGVDRNALIWTTDVCTPAPLQDACDHYNAEIDRVQAQARIAQATEKKALDREILRLRTVSNSRCRR